MPPLDDALKAATQLAQSGRIAEAIPAFQAILKEDPRHVEAMRLLAIAYLSTGQFPTGLGMIERAIGVAPQRADLHHLKAEALAVTGQLDAAIQSLDRSVELNPAVPQVRALLATCLMQNKDLDGAEDEYAEALRLNPAFAEAATNLANVRTMTGRPQEGAAVISDAAAKSPTNVPLLTNRCVLLNYADGVSREESLEAHKTYGRVLAAMPAPPVPLPPLANTKDPERRLRVGILSPDLFDHSVAYFVRPLLEGRDRTKFEYFIYSTAPRADAMTRSIQSLADQWREVARANEAQLIQQIRADGVDVLIELSGHTQGGRLPALRLRGAPVQMTYIGYPNTTGVAAMDCRLVDSLTDPPGAEAWATERLIRLDPCFLCYTPPPGSPAPATEPPSSSSGGVTFGSFNSIKKLSPSTAALWAGVLAQVPESRLVIKSAGLSSQRAQEHLVGLFTGVGLTEDRLELLDRIESKADHLSAYDTIDVALDTFPYNGTTTTCEAMWMGVPVVSLVGDRHASRVGLSLLSAVGLRDLAVESPEAFTRAAAALTGDRARLTELRRMLRSRMQRSPLCDAAAFVARFQKAVREAWRGCCV
jgi:predicted O-linked N-acetylglucosamine transferase (SPINDLY family)